MASLSHLDFWRDLSRVGRVCEFRRGYLHAVSHFALALAAYVTFRATGLEPGQGPQWCTGEELTPSPGALELKVRD